jgi:hypothetical protein
VSDETAFGTKDNPSTTGGRVVLIISLPRELCARRTVAGAVANIEEAPQRAEGDFAVRRAFECQMRRLDEIKEVVVPNVHLDDTPATGKSLGEGKSFAINPFPR